MHTSPVSLSAWWSRTATLSRAALLGGFLCLLVCCDDETEVFERRYAVARIPELQPTDFLGLLNDPDPNMRYLALANLLALGALEYPAQAPDAEQGAAPEYSDALAAALRLLLDDPAPKVRAIATFAPLQRSGDEGLAQVLDRLDDTSDTVRIEALASLGNSPTPELDPAATGRILKALLDDNLLIRLQALETLGRSIAPEQADTVALAIRDWLPGRTLVERLKALEALGGIHAEASMDVLKNALSGGNPEELTLAAKGLETLKWPELEAELLAMLKDGRASEAFVLGFLTETATAKSQPAALARLQHEDPEIRGHALYILVRVGDNEAFEAIGALFDTRAAGFDADLSADRNTDMEIPEDLGDLEGALLKLGTRIGTLPDAPALPFDLVASERLRDRLLGLAILRNDVAFDRALVEESPTEPDMVGALLPLARDPSALVRLATYPILGNSTDPRAARALVQGLDESSPMLARAAATAILSHSRLTGNWQPLRDLYARREMFAPTTYGDEDRNLALRQALENAIAAMEGSRATVGRSRAELDPSQTTSTRLLAAARFQKANRNEASDTLLHSIEAGSPGERRFAHQALAEHHADITPPLQARLRQLAAKEADPEWKEKLNALAELPEREGR